MSDPSALPVRVSIRLDLASGGKIGPGKIALLEAIAETGSIAAASRALGMSYPRAWGLVSALDAAIGAPVVTRAPGGQKGGGAALTATGRALIARYREVEAAAQREAGPPPSLATICSLLPSNYNEADATPSEACACNAAFSPPSHSSACSPPPPPPARRRRRSPSSQRPA